MKGSPFKKLIRQIHLWLGITTGSVVFIVSTTGCTYVFEDELKLFFYADRMYVDVPVGASKKSNTELYQVAQDAAGEDHPIQQIEISTEANRSYVFKPAIIRNTKAFTYFGEYKYFQVIYVNPYLGKVILWWPKNIAAIKQRLSFQWKSKTKWKRKNYDLHSILGFYILPFALVVSLTGLTWSFNWFNDSVQWLANGGNKVSKSKPIFSDTTQLIRTVSLFDVLVNMVIRQNPQARLIHVNFPKEKKGTLNISVLEDERLNYNRTQFQYDQFSGTLLKSTTFKDKNTGEKLNAMNYDLHTGRIFSLLGKFLAFFASLVSASLPISGFMVWLGKRKKSKIEIENVSILPAMVQNES